MFCLKEDIMFANQFEPIENELSKIGVCIRNSDNTNKLTSEVIIEIGRVWSKLDPIQERYFSKVLSGL
jgi:hypothetical protein